MFCLACVNLRVAVCGMPCKEMDGTRSSSKNRVSIVTHNAHFLRLNNVKMRTTKDKDYVEYRVELDSGLPRLQRKRPIPGSLHERPKVKLRDGRVSRGAAGHSFESSQDLC